MDGMAKVLGGLVCTWRKHTSVFVRRKSCVTRIKQPSRSFAACLYTCNWKDCRTPSGVLIKVDPRRITVRSLTSAFSSLTLDTLEMKPDHQYAKQIVFVVLCLKMCQISFGTSYSVAHLAILWCIFTPNEDLHSDSDFRFISSVGQRSSRHWFCSESLTITTWIRTFPR